MELYKQALTRLQRLLTEAKKLDLREPLAMSLATADASGRPSIRTVLLKMLDERGLTFFSNARSRKGQQLAENPHAALCFYWQPLMEQVIVEGEVEEISEEEADAYWATRDRDSQLSAWASQQSEPLASREALQLTVKEYAEKFKGQQIPRPSHWLGYRVIPERIEFWRAGWHRLNDRVCYKKSGDDWTVTLLNP